MLGRSRLLLFFFFNDTATTEIYTLSLHDALPIWAVSVGVVMDLDVVYLDTCAWEGGTLKRPGVGAVRGVLETADRKSTRLNSSHVRISYAVFCLKKKKTCERLRRIVASHDQRALE